MAAVADDAPSERAAHFGPKNMLKKSIAPRQQCHRKRAPGGGRHHKAQHVRAALFEWFTSIRYAIDWKQLIANNRSRGRIHLARFPASMLKLKAQQFLQDYVHACLVNGQPVVSFTADSHWPPSVGSGIWFVHATGEPEVRGPKAHCQGAPWNIVGRVVPYSIFHFLGVWIRPTDR